MWGFFEKPPHTPKNLIGWFEQSLRKFSIIRKRIIGLETPIPPLRTSTTVGIVLSKLRKSLLRSNFLKFTYYVPQFKVCANNKKLVEVANHRFSKRLLKCEKNVMFRALSFWSCPCVRTEILSVTFAPPDWHKGAIESRAERFARSLWTQHKLYVYCAKLYKRFLRSFFQKATLFL